MTSPSPPPPTSLPPQALRRNLDWKDVFFSFLADDRNRYRRGQKMRVLSGANCLAVNSQNEGSRSILEMRPTVNPFSSTLIPRAPRCLARTRHAALPPSPRPAMFLRTTAPGRRVGLPRPPSSLQAPPEPPARHFPAPSADQRAPPEVSAPTAGAGGTDSQPPSSPGRPPQPRLTEGCCVAKSRRAPRCPSHPGLLPSMVFVDLLASSRLSKIKKNSRSTFAKKLITNKSTFAKTLILKSKVLVPHVKMLSKIRNFESPFTKILI